MTELFPESEVAMPSPRLAWLRQHGLTLRQLPNGKFECLFAEDIGRGDDGDAACADLCNKTGLRHWNE